MEDLKKAVSAAFENVVASGAIELAIEKQLASAITRAVEEQFSSYGDFSKAIKAKISTLIDVDVAEIDLPSYRDLVGKIIKQRVGAVMTEQFTTLLDKDIGELLQPAPATITLEALLKEFVEYQLEYREHLRGQPFTLHIEHSNNLEMHYVDIYLSNQESVGKFQCDFQFRVKGDGEVWGLKIGSADVNKQIFMGQIFSFEKRLFQMYTAKTKIIIPEHATASDFDTRFTDQRDE